jgi:DNA-binding MarR family transcriptional regulator
MSVSTTGPAPAPATKSRRTARLSGRDARSASDASIGPSDERLIQTLLWALKPLSNLRGSMPLPFVIAFLTVALDEGKAASAYARALGISRTAMSRYLRDIGDRSRNGGPGLGLVTVQARPAHSNRRPVVLTAKGRETAKLIFEPMRRARAPNPRVADALDANAETI